jgi:hypothetical protein
LVVTPAALMAIENLRLMRLRWFARSGGAPRGMPLSPSAG